MRIYCVTVAVYALTCFSGVLSQSDGPTPSRLQIPGAIALGAFPVPLRSAQFRNDRQNAEPPLIRIRRPTKSQQINSIPIQRSLDEAKPVTEEHEDEQSFIPHIVQHSQPQALVQHNHQNVIAQEHEHVIDQQTLIPRFNPQERPQPILHRVPAPERFVPSEKEFPSAGAQRFGFSQDRSSVHAQPQQFQLPQQKTTIRRPRPQFEPEPEIQQTPRRIQHVPIRPRTSAENSQQQEREKKPVAQILRKYREENEDGTITWGFENDDGSYKEEIIGIDCVTRGRYGYVDPDGMKREYTYETGIQCDPNKRGQEDDDIQVAGSYIDYQENTMVLANGDRINLGNIGKNKARRPAIQSSYRN